MTYNIHRIVVDKLIELKALFDLDHITVVKDEKDKEKIKKFINRLPEIIKCFGG